ncbi:nuclear transport factor 2 family protein [Rhizobium sp. ZPR3]|uniref:Nuclear transport factor 2 family protein n=2 Tax=unclassified Rhizobium TaxID=2613769 RepID=A0AAU7SQX2_9HYPH
MHTAENLITHFFDWWNDAYRENCFSTEGFARYFTPNATFIVDGNLRGTGPEEINRHFQRIKRESDDVEIVTPAITTLSDKAVGFVRYRATFRAGNLTGTEECLAWACMREDKISAIEIFSRPA